MWFSWKQWSYLILYLWRCSCTYWEKQYKFFFTWFFFFFKSWSKPTKWNTKHNHFIMGRVIFFILHCGKITVTNKSLNLQSIRCNQWKNNNKKHHHLQLHNSAWDSGHFLQISPVEESGMMELIHRPLWSTRQWILITGGEIVTSPDGIIPGMENATKLCYYFCPLNITKLKSWDC